MMCVCIAAKSGIVPLGNLGPTSALLEIYGFRVEASQLKMLLAYFLIESHLVTILLQCFLAFGLTKWFALSGVMKCPLGR